MRSRRQRKIEKIAATALQGDAKALARRKLRFAAIEYNLTYGPDETAGGLYLLLHQFRTPGAFRDAALLAWDKPDE